MNFTSYSQASQDKFVFELLVKPENYLEGSFLDIGCGDPVFISNTYALELLGWRGILIDGDPQWEKPCAEKRLSPFVCYDATKIDWSLLCGAQTVWDYISLDVDHAQVAALKNLLAHGIRFRAATVEHDFYRFGPGPRKEIRALLHAAGYTILCEDVLCGGPEPYEDFWIDSKRVNPSVASRFSCVMTEGAEIAKR
jgi:hypothetical protein